MITQVVALEDLVDEFILYLAGEAACLGADECSAASQAPLALRSGRSIDIEHTNGAWLGPGGADTGNQNWNVVPAGHTDLAG